MGVRDKRRFNRRGFLKGTAKSAAMGAAALVASPLTGENVAAQDGQSTTPAPRVPAAPPSARVMAAETGPVTPAEAMVTDRPGSDFMVDVLKSLGFEYAAANPGSSFRSLQESFINYGKNKAPEWLTCLHEESSVFMATGYALTENKPMLAVAHSTVGLQHASAAIYDAFANHAPAFIVLGNIMDVPARRPGVEWNHSAQDAVAMVRDFTKWDDTPASLTHFAESAVRAYKIAMTPPCGPVVIVADADLQENPVSDTARAQLRVPRLSPTFPPAGDSGAVAELAKWLVAAENPVIMGGSAISTAEGMQVLVELAETLQAPVVGGKFPSRHPLCGAPNLVRSADLILGLEVNDLWGTVNTYRDQLVRESHPIIRQGTKLATITANDLYLKSNYQNFMRYTEVDMAIAADAEATLPSLLEAVKRLVTPDRHRVFEERGKKLATASLAALDQARQTAAYGWDASPISTPRLSAEIWNVIKDKDWVSVSGPSGVSRLWNVEKHYQILDDGGSACAGSRFPRAIGAALAHRKHGRFAVNIQKDGDFSYVPGVLWTAAHHRIPVLNVMHNNRAYHQEVMHIQRMANRHQRGVDINGLGCTLWDPFIDFASIAKGFGVWAEGPITDPKDLGPALKRAADIVARGEPALLDVVTQPR